MKLNPDCVRDVLLSVEKLHQIEQLENGSVIVEPVHWGAICADLPKYNRADVFYTLKTLGDGGLIDIDVQYADGGMVWYCEVSGLTFAGHEFIQKIRDNKQWGTIKKCLDALRNYSIDAISAVAEGITKAGIQSFVQTNV